MWQSSKCSPKRRTLSSRSPPASFAYDAANEIDYGSCLIEVTLQVSSYKGSDHVTDSLHVRFEDR